jgi:hypothetical protein
MGYQLGQHRFQRNAVQMMMCILCHAFLDQGSG